jgi:hypothetical protein
MPEDGLRGRSDHHGRPATSSAWAASWLPTTLSHHWPMSLYWLCYRVDGTFNGLVLLESETELHARMLLPAHWPLQPARKALTPVPAPEPRTLLRASEHLHRDRRAARRVARVRPPLGPQVGTRSPRRWKPSRSPECQPYAFSAARRGHHNSLVRYRHTGTTAARYLLARSPAGLAEMLLKRTGSGSCRSTRWWVEGTGGT